MKKFELTSESIVKFGKTLYRSLYHTRESIQIYVEEISHC